MAFTARVLFNGLCAFVPNTEESRGMRVLLIDGRAPGLAPNGKGHVSHVPAVRFRPADLDPDLKQPAFRYDYSSQDPEPRGAWMLAGDDLELRVDGEPLPPGPLRVRRDGTDLDFDGVPSMRDIYPDRGGLEVQDACLEGGLTRLSDAGLVGRIRLHGGEVGVYPGDDRRCFLSAEEYVFTGSPSTERHRLAACAYFDVEVAGETLEVHSRQRGHGPVFRPADGERLELMIENEPPMDLMGSKPDESSIDYDFELLYRVAKDLPPEPRLPMLAVAAVSGASRAAGYPHGGAECADIQYNDSEEAVVFNPDACPFVQYNDSGQASVRNEKLCPFVQYGPSEEASVSNENLCPFVQFEPSEEASGYNRPLCPFVGYNPSHRA